MEINRTEDCAVGVVNAEIVLVACVSILDVAGSDAVDTFPTPCAAVEDASEWDVETVLPLSALTLDVSVCNVETVPTSCAPDVAFEGIDD